MIQKIEIENFKSIDKLSIDLSRFNVLIGANGSGKSNILEAIAFASCALTGKLENGDFALKGVRINEPRFYRSGFNVEKLNKQIDISLFAENNYKVSFEINNSNLPFSRWESFMPIPVNGASRFYPNDLDDAFLKKMEEAKNISRDKISSFNLQAYIIYSPENYFLRNLNINEPYIEPIGYRGEGLLKLFRIIAKEHPEQVNEIVSNLKLIDWFDSIELSNDKLTGETEFLLNDKYLEEGIKSFDIRNTNEGFHFLLFYLTLFISNYTPKFFAVDNIDTAFNPKLCSKVVALLFDLAVKYDKQVIFTTHNPSILDGLNLNDSEQRLYTISRSKSGHTKATRVEKKQPLDNMEALKLSEQFLRGYIGGLPKNF